MTRGQTRTSGKALLVSLAFLVAQVVKNLPAMWEAWVRSLGWEDPLEKGMATHSNILAWRSPWTEEPGQANACVVSPKHTNNTNGSQIFIKTPSSVDNSQWIQN